MPVQKEFVKNPLEIIALLKNIQRARQLVSVSLDGLPEHALSSLLDVQMDKRVLVFDETNPSLDSDYLLSKKWLDFNLRLNGLPVSFKTRVIPQINDNNFIYTEFPEEIYYPQYRQFYRYQTEFLEDLKATLYLSSTNRIECKLVDISLQGLSISLPVRFAPIFRENQFVNDIFIQLPTHESFSIAAIVKNIRKPQGTENNIVVGLEIHQQQKRIEKIIQQFIFRSEKEQVSSSS